jgi:hypothetical protein
MIKEKKMTSELDAFLANYSKDIQMLVQQIREIILNELAGMQEMVDAPSKIIAYGRSPKYADLVCAIAPFSKHVNLMFSRGASLPNPDGILQGTGKKARHIKVESLNKELSGKIEQYFHYCKYE